MQPYQQFLQGKAHTGLQHGIDPNWMPDFLFPFQRDLVQWALLRGRAAIFADCGLGKTPMQLVWAHNIVWQTNGRVLILTPLAVGSQTVREGEKFGIPCAQSRDGRLPQERIVITNYEQLQHFNATDFVACVCDESGCLKNFAGVHRKAITAFMRTLPYRLLCTATAAPNDYIELGTSSEAIGELGNADMLSRFFKREESFYRKDNRGGQGWYLRDYAKRDFWRWVCSWARAIRKPSDMGYDDNGFVLPALETREHMVHARTKREGYLFDLPAANLNEQREERRRTMPERCEMAAQLATHDKPVVCWCHLNPEGDLLTKLIPGAVQVSGADADEHKEEVFAAFAAGQIRALVTKPTIAGFGLNWQHCAHETFFPSHSFEQWYQAVRRCWRFGQTNPVTVDVIASEGERGVLANLRRKSDAADAMFEHLVALMHDELSITRTYTAPNTTEVASWLTGK